MTDPEKAMHRLKHSFGVYKDVSEVDADLEIINQALQRAAECEKMLQEESASGDASLKCSWLCMQKHKALNDKAQGLLSTMELIRYAVHGEASSLRREAKRAVIAFKADETEGGGV